MKNLILLLSLALLASCGVFKNKSIAPNYYEGEIRIESQYNIILIKSMDELSLDIDSSYNPSMDFGYMDSIIQEKFSDKIVQMQYRK